ncbi:hypothetical protein [Desulforamulus aquiferis]|uniref:LSM domain-containing protein n=1 Tax=Desulforamulus aquiferis TaxID=1397668 RepID=A0AAW7Z9I0_9FIRM|nr:hypothetical protein [Desulforamulus aquiferis]MDO7786317.1 hypothetical protein [Desulforamulus aquiferis]
MLEQLQADYGKKITIELVNGRKISGKIIAVSEQFVRLESNEGIGTVPISAIQVVWESVQNLTEENMDYLAEKLRKSTDENRINCTSVSGFTCLNQYVCIPPDNCVYTFACPGVYTPAGPQAGCPRFQFYQPCGFRFHFIPCGRPFTQPCYFRFVPSPPPCGPFQFQQPCGPFQFQQPCGPFQFQQPCGPFQFGSQCPTPGGFACPGQAFIGISPGFNSPKMEEKE